jgi:hypothetical protein
MEKMPPRADGEGGNMRGRTGIVMVVFAALVAGTLAIVYGFRADEISPDKAAAGPAPGMELSEAENVPAKPESDAPKPAPASPPPDDAPEPLDAEPAPLEPMPSLSAHGEDSRHDIDQLPPEIRAMLVDIVVAAQSGDIEEMRAVLEQNELKPMLSSAPVGDPIAFWKKASADGEGREVLAAMLNVFGAGYAKQGDGKDATYVWPYFAEMDLTKLTPAEEVKLYRIVPAAEATAMKKAGKYSYYRAGIGSDGVWHYFMK